MAITNLVGNDPSKAGAMDLGWVESKSSGVLKWASRTTGNGGIQGNELAVSLADSGLISRGPITVTNGSGTGIATDLSGDPDKVTITLTSGASLSTADADCVITVGDADSGSFGAGVIGASDQTPQANGEVLLTDGGLGANWDGTITYKENIDEPVTYFYSDPILVPTKMDWFKTVLPATSNPEYTTQWQYTVEDKSSERAADQTDHWINLGADDASAKTVTYDPATSGDWTAMKKRMKKLRVKITGTDADTGGLGALTALDDGNTVVEFGGVYQPLKSEDWSAVPGSNVTISGIGRDAS